jgi:hypothetical protein
LVDEVVMTIQSSPNPTPFLRGDVPIYHVVSHPIQPVVEKVVTSMQSLVDPTLLLESVESTKMVTSMQSLADPTLLLRSDVSTDYVYRIFISVLSEQGGIPLTLRTPPPSPRMVSFNWNDLLEPRLPSFEPFQIRFKVNSNNIYRCIIDEGSSTSILSSWAWQALGSPELVSASHELLAFDRHPSEYLGVLPQLPISLGGKTFLFNVIVVQVLLHFNMLLGGDYVYVMNVVVSTLFQVMHFPHNGSIVTIDQLKIDNHHPNSVFFQDSPLYVPSVCVDSTPWDSLMSTLCCLSSLL